MRIPPRGRGEGPQHDELVDLVAELDLAGRVELRPFSPGARHLYPTFDAYLLPSRLEAFPVTVQEAMQAGVPVVATEVGSIREAVDDGRTGFVVPVGDVGALAAAVRTLAEDPAMRGDGPAGAEVALERFDVDRRRSLEQALPERRGPAEPLLGGPRSTQSTQSTTSSNEPSEACSAGSSAGAQPSPDPLVAETSTS
ncbi:MAG: glycosyltransferase [Microthrixaceae bacterium]